MKIGFECSPRHEESFLLNHMRQILNNIHKLTGETYNISKWWISEKHSTSFWQKELDMIPFGFVSMLRASFNSQGEEITRGPNITTIVWQSTLMFSSSLCSGKSWFMTLSWITHGVYFGQSKNVSNTSLLKDGLSSLMSFYLSSPPSKYSSV